jgi:hypothetical protein
MARYRAHRVSCANRKVSRLLLECAGRSVLATENSLLLRALAYQGNAASITCKRFDEGNCGSRTPSCPAYRMLPLAGAVLFLGVLPALFMAIVQ